MGRVEFTDNYEDLSTENGYQFKFVCESCGNGHLSSWQASATGIAGSVLRTAGSLFGAVHGARGIPPHWHAGFKGKVATYLNGWPEFSIEDVLERFEVQARRAF